MKDGRTRKLELHETGRKAGFLATHSAAIVFAAGPLGGSELPLEKERVTLGRGAGVDVMLDDASVSHQHAALELAGAGFRIRDLGSTNGVRVNGSRVAGSGSEARRPPRDRLALVPLPGRERARRSRRTHHLSED